MHRLTLTAALLVLAPSLALAKPKPAPEPPPPPPGPAPIAATVFYTDCIADAAARQTIDRDGHYLNFKCAGGAAQRFFEKLGTFDGKVTAEQVIEGKTWRFTQTPKKDTYGLDGCWRSVATPTDYGCLLVYPAGTLLMDGK